MRLRFILLFTIQFWIPQLHASEFSGVWGENCDSTNDGAVYVIARAHSEGLYQIGYPRVSMSTPTRIEGDPDFEVVNVDELVYKGSYLYRCEKMDVPDYSPISTAHLEDLIIGEWRIMYRAAGGRGRKTLISDGRTGIPDMSFSKTRQVALKLKDDVRRMAYDIKDQELILHFEGGQKRIRVLSVNETELHLTEDDQPNNGILIFLRHEG
jgi:hypothetical protein